MASPSRRDFGTVRRLESGKWQARYYDPNGVRRSRTFATKGDATRWLSRVSADLDRNEWRDPQAGRETFAEFVARWMPARTYKGRRLAPRSTGRDEGIIRNHLMPTFGRMPLRAIDDPSVRAWHAMQMASDLADASVAKHYRLLHKIMEDAKGQRLVTQNPCQIEGAGTERSKRREPFTVDEINRLADAVPHRWRALILIAGWCGLRFGELAGLKVSDIDLDLGVIHVTGDLDELDGGTLQPGEVKTEAGFRTVVMPPHLLTSVREHRNRYTPGGSHDPFFVGPKGGRLRRSNFRMQVLLPALAAAGIEGRKTFHDFRHSSVTLAATAGASLAENMARHGHASASASMRYQHSTAARDAELAQRMSAQLAG